MVVYLYEEFVILVCEDCGEEYILDWDEFEDMLEEEGLELEIFEDDECEYCDCDDCEGCYDYEDESVEEEIDEELIELLDEMRLCREDGNYEGYAILAKAYATLFGLIYE